MIGMSAYIAATRAGKVGGAEIADGVVAWSGIPYAAPPLGELRLRAPEPAAAWNGVREATSYAAPSLQSLLFPLAGASAAGLGAAPLEMPEPSEDCLYLNVVAPAGATNLPVLVWIHGGGYQTGDGTQGPGDGAVFARAHGVVVVSFNYRLGALGFLAVDGEEHSGAFGLHDQIAALRWVRENIAGFGGDPDRVTVYGISAGAKSVANLLASPHTKGLIHQAASSSGGADHVATSAQAAAVAARFFRELGTGPQNVRRVGAQEILAAQNAIGSGMSATWLWRPAIDGSALTGRPLDAIAAGSAAGIPLLAQTCVNECFLYQLMSPDAAGQAERVLAEYFGESGRDELLAAYTAARPELADDPTRLGVEIMTDERYVVPTGRLADAQSAHAPVWRSRYDVPLTGMPKSIAPDGKIPAMHGADGTPVWNGGAGVAALLHQTWGDFVNRGVPNAPGLPEWPGYDTSRRATLVFDEPEPWLAEDPNGAQRAAWDGREWPSGTWWDLRRGRG
jgi:para-nitrobenzyl esterase